MAEQDQVIIQEEVTTIEIFKNAALVDVITITEPSVIDIVEIGGEQGVPGVAGADGSTYAFLTETFTVDTVPVYSYNILGEPVNDSVSLFLNGLKERNSNFSVTSIGIVWRVNVDPLVTLTEGDLLEVAYLIEI